MSKELTMLESIPLPEELGGFAENLQREHETDPFSICSRSSARRVGEIASRYGLVSVNYRGEIELPEASLDRTWSVCRARGNKQSVWVVDVSLPLGDEDFRQLLPAYVAGDMSDNELEERALVSGFDTRVIGIMPEKVQYRGQPFWSYGRHMNH